jgi:hypothetical protein
MLVFYYCDRIPDIINSKGGKVETSSPHGIWETKRERDRRGWDIPLQEHTSNDLTSLHNALPPQGFISPHSSMGWGPNLQHMGL